MYEIIVGRDAEDRRKFGLNGTFMLGRHYVKMGQTTSLSNDVLMDFARSHVVFVTGKRGSGKSFTLGSIAEGMMTSSPELTSRLSVIMFDTMGIYWTMKYENKRDEALLREWNLKYSDLNLKVYVPSGHFGDAKEKGIPVDAAFSIKPSELSVNDWCSTFNLEIVSPIGALIGRIVSEVKGNYDVDDIIASINSDDRSDHYTQAAAENLFLTARSWGLFSKDGISFSELVVPGQISVIDVSGYASAVNRASVRALVIGLVSKKLFSERMTARKEEEYKSVKSFTRLIEQEDEKKEVPLIWIMVDECLPYRARIRTEKGIMSIGNFVKNYEKGNKIRVSGYDINTGKVSHYNVTKAFRILERSLFKLTTETGREIKCTSDHSLLTRKGFVRAADAKELSTPLLSPYTSNKKMIVARVAGHIFGDGYLSEKAQSVGFSGKGNFDDLTKIKEDMSQLGFKSGSIHSRQTCSSITTSENLKLKVVGLSQEFKSSIKAFRYFSSLALPVGDKAMSAQCIPPWLIKASSYEKAEFLGALMGSDGTAPSQIPKIRGDFNPIRLSFNKAANLEKEGFTLATQIKCLFEDLGIQIASLTKRPGNVRKNGVKTFKIVITLGKSVENTIKFLEKVGYRYCEEKEIRGKKWLCYLKARKYELKKRQNLIKRTKKLHNLGLDRKKISKLTDIPYYLTKEWVHTDRSAGIAKSFPSFQEWISSREGNNVLYEKIDFVVVSKPEPLFDLTVEKVHNFIAEDFIVHNCHEFLPKHGSTPATDALQTLLREGRQPGISLVLASQQPGQIHTDVMTQSDIVIAHHITAKIDIDSLGALMQSYMREGLDVALANLPDVKGAAILFDDTNERLYPIRVRPRITWHGGSSPTLLKEEKKFMEL